MPGIKHLIQCHCTLAIYKKNEKIINHKFPVYSFLDKLDNIIPKFVQCNNCGTIHFVKNVGNSEIKFGKEDSKMIKSIDSAIKDIPKKLSQILIENNATLADYEHAFDIINDKEWGSYIVLGREIHDDKEHVKLIEILSSMDFKIKNEIIEDLVVNKGD